MERTRRAIALGFFDGVHVGHQRLMDMAKRRARETGAIVTSEEATVLGGLGSAVCECVAAGCPVPVVRHGVQDEFGRSGAAKEVLAAYGLTAEGIIRSVRQVLTLKK